ncbi:MAG: hypothetical protein ACREUU_00455 [Gammaproteobacteria bacterium]
MISGTERQGWLVVLGLSLTVPSSVAQNGVVVGGPGRANIAGGAFGEVYSTERFGIFGIPSTNVKFKLDRVVSGPNTPVSLGSFLIVSPSSGVTPSTVRVAPNPNVTRKMRPGQYAAVVYFTTVDQTPPVTTGAIVILTLRAPPPPSIGSVVNTASLHPMVSPATVVSILGDSLGPPVHSAEYDIEGLYPTTFGFTTVTFNGTRAPLLHVTSGRIDAIAPYPVAGQKTAQVVVSRYGVSTAPFEVPVTDTAPAIFTVASNGTGQGDILNYAFPNYSRNNADNPAVPGQMIVFYATGAGVLDDAVSEASISLIASPIRSQPVSLTIGGLPARIYYAGAAPFESIAKLQINAFVPEGVGSGPQPVVLTIGQADNAQQQVTVAIR